MTKCKHTETKRIFATDEHEKEYTVYIENSVRIYEWCVDCGAIKIESGWVTPYSQCD